MVNATQKTSAFLFSKSVCKCCRLYRNCYIVTALVFVLVLGIIVNQYLLFTTSRHSSQPTLHHPSLKPTFENTITLFVQTNEATTASQPNTESQGCSSQQVPILQADYCQRTFPYQVLQTKPTHHHNPSVDIYVSSSIANSGGDPSRVHEADVREILLEDL
jgi:hypothetical protein